MLQSSWTCILEPRAANGLFGATVTFRWPPRWVRPVFHRSVLKDTGSGSCGSISPQTHPQRCFWVNQMQGRCVQTGHLWIKLFHSGTNIGDGVAVSKPGHSGLLARLPSEPSKLDQTDAFRLHRPTMSNPTWMGESAWFLRSLVAPCARAPGGSKT